MRPRIVEALGAWVADQFYDFSNLGDNADVISIATASPVNMLCVEITFLKQTERDYEVFVRRDDGVALQVRSFDRQRRLPHDIAHFVVENELRLQHGFWGLLAAGAADM